MTDDHVEAHLVRAGDVISLPEHGAPAAIVASGPIRDPDSGNVFLRVVSDSGDHRWEATYEVPAHQMVTLIPAAVAVRRGQREAVAALQHLLTDGYRLPLLHWTISPTIGALDGHAFRGDGPVRAALDDWSGYLGEPVREDTDPSGVTRGYIHAVVGEVPVTVWGETAKGQHR